MRISVRRADCAGGFTLLEVVLAVTIFAAVSAAVMAVYVRSAGKTARAREISIAVSTARNALEEAVAEVAVENVEAAIPERDSLRISLKKVESEEDAAPLTDTFTAEVDGEDGNILRFTAMRALYAIPLAGEGEEDDE